MADFKQHLERVSTLSPIVKTGYFSCENGDDCGVTLSASPPRSCLLISARQGQKPALTKLLKKHYGVSLPNPQHSQVKKTISIAWTGNDQWFLTGVGDDHVAFFNQGCDRLLTAASVCDQSQGRSTITVSGPCARALLEKGMPVDLHESVFKTGSCATTEIAQIAVHISQSGSEEYEISCGRSFSESLWHWACEMSLEFGYFVK